MAIFKVLGAKIPARQNQALEKYLRKNGLTRSAFVRHFVGAALAALEAGRDPITENGDSSSEDEGRPAPPA